MEYKAVTLPMYCQGDEFDRLESGTMWRENCANWQSLINFASPQLLWLSHTKREIKPPELKLRMKLGLAQSIIVFLINFFNLCQCSNRPASKGGGCVERERLHNENWGMHTLLEGWEGGSTGSGGLNLKVRLWAGHWLHLEFDASWQYLGLDLSNPSTCLDAGMSSLGQRNDSLVHVVECVWTGGINCQANVGRSLQGRGLWNRSMSGNRKRRPAKARGKKEDRKKEKALSAVARE